MLVSMHLNASEDASEHAWIWLGFECLMWSFTRVCLPPLPFSHLELFILRPGIKPGKTFSKILEILQTGRLNRNKVWIRKLGFT